MLLGNFLLIFTIVVLIDVGESETRILKVEHYDKMDEVTHILKRAVHLMGIKTKRRVIHLMPLDSTAYVNTDKLKQRAFRIRTVVGKTNCMTFDGDCFLANVTEVSIVDIRAERDTHGWLDILRITEGNNRVYEYKD